MDLLNEDLWMEAPRNYSAFTIWIGGLNDTTIEKIGPTLSWIDSDLILKYTATLKLKQLSGCQYQTREENANDCSSVNTENIGLGDTCLLTGNKQTLKPRVIPEASCQHFSYDVAIAKNTEAQEKMKSLKLSVSREIMTMRTERSKFGLTDGFSILGGVIGSILEITLLNIIAVLAFGLGLFQGCMGLLVGGLKRDS